MKLFNKNTFILKGLVKVNIKKIILLVVTFLLFNCKSYDETIKKYRPLPEHAVSEALEKYDAKNEHYSLLIFTSGFSDDDLKITNDSILFNGLLKSDKSMGLSKIIRINNSHNVNIIDKTNNKSIRLTRSNLVKYKYCYIRKNVGIYKNKSKFYTVIYSNSLRGFR
ncbi:MAG: hypothetical protein ACK5M1_12760 [Xanthomarina gelatinilytica]|uniref:hypothetical protein n=1 Tax=Xanthomarina gelatinilytica TaxID=1137281 RepID=UPI003A84E4E3